MEKGTYRFEENWQSQRGKRFPGIIVKANYRWSLRKTEVGNEAFLYEQIIWSCLGFGRIIIIIRDWGWLLCGNWKGVAIAGIDNQGLLERKRANLFLAIGFKKRIERTDRQDAWKRAKSQRYETGISEMQREIHPRGKGSWPSWVANTGRRGPLRWKWNQKHGKKVHRLLGHHSHSRAKD